MSIESVQGALAALGSAYRGDWSEMDGRTLHSQLEQIAVALDPEVSMTYETLCLLVGVCPVNRCWPEHCDERIGISVDCAHMVSGAALSTQEESK